MMGGEKCPQSRQESDRSSNWVRSPGKKFGLMQNFAQNWNHPSSAPLSSTVGGFEVKNVANTRMKPNTLGKNPISPPTRPIGPQKILFHPKFNGELESDKKKVTIWPEKCGKSR